jgi:hypothetical protein
MVYTMTYPHDAANRRQSKKQAQDAADAHGALTQRICINSSRVKRLFSDRNRKQMLSPSIVSNSEQAVEVDCFRKQSGTLDADRYVVLK